MSFSIDYMKEFLYVVFVYEFYMDITNEMEIIMIVSVLVVLFTLFMYYVTSNIFVTILFFIVASIECIYIMGKWPMIIKMLTFNKP